MKTILKNIPQSPGIYQFFDVHEKIIYIGKSVNLKARVNSYFAAPEKLSPAKQKMVAQIHNLVTIVTNNETESLILETTLIKKHLPKYNILMKDGKNHIYIKITSEIIPRILKTRIAPSQTQAKNGLYFGPYTSTNYVNHVLQILKKIFGYRSCGIVFEKHPSPTLPFQEREKNSQIIPPSPERGGVGGGVSLKSVGNTKIPCMDYYINRCAGPCLLEKEKIDSYLEKIEHIKLFLKGENNTILKNFEEKMKQKAKELKFEEAQKIKNDYDSIKSIQTSQIVQEGVQGDYDVVNYCEKFNTFFMGLIQIRESKIVGFYNYEIQNALEEDTQTIFRECVERQFALAENKKITFLVPIEITQQENMEIDIEVPKIGIKKELLDLCYKNIYEYAYKSHLDSLSTKGFTKSTMQNLLSELGYKQINKDILFECNDISHISGNYTVASRSIIENGKPNPSKYKKFKIKTLAEQKINDFDSMREIMTRRLAEIKKIGFVPDLIIIDGGKGQLSSVMEIISQEKSKHQDEQYLSLLNKVQIVSIAKKQEELFLPNDSHPILLDKESLEIKLIQRIRDEAHRFAITFNRDSRIKAMKKNILESLPGIGPKTRKKILKEFGSLENLKSIPKETLEKSLGKNIIEILENHGMI